MDKGCGERAGEGAEKEREEEVAEADRERKTNRTKQQQQRFVFHLLLPLRSRYASAYQIIPYRFTH